MRPLLVALAALPIACLGQPLPAPPLNRDCESVRVFRSCAQLAIVTPREPLSFSSMPKAPLTARHGIFESFVPPALLQHYALDGTPPRFHATDDVVLDRAAFSYGSATDGDELFILEPREQTLAVARWNEENLWLGDTRVSNNGSYGVIAATRGLALILHDHISMVDATGSVVLSRGAKEANLDAVTAYGCGFAYTSFFGATASLHTMPLDGRDELDQPSSYAAPERWPWDPHAVVFVSHSNDQCKTTLDLLFDDGRDAIHREYPATCTFVNGAVGGVYETSFGVVLFMGDMSFALLDSNANLIGTPVRIPFEGDEPSVVVAALGDWVAALTTELSLADPLATAYVETVLGCAQ